MSRSESDVESQQAEGTSKQVVLQTLISPERARKFDLLLHLLTNLHQGLVVCGPEGIGKTTALQFFQSQADEKMAVCFLESSVQLDFSAIQVQLLAAACGLDQRETKGGIEGILIDQLLQMEKTQRILVLLLDNAGHLEPTLLTTICRFAASYPAFRPVFAMTSDDLQIKGSTDPVIDDCHVVEIPSLSEQQCGEYLKNLSGKPDSLIRFAAITPALVQKVYRETHGIPGRIISILPKINKMKVDPVAPKVIPIESALLGIAIVAGALFWFLSSQDQVETSRSEANKEHSRQARTSVKISAVAAVETSERQERAKTEKTGRAEHPETETIVDVPAGDAPKTMVGAGDSKEHAGPGAHPMRMPPGGVGGTETPLPGTGDARDQPLRRKAEEATVVAQQKAFPGGREPGGIVNQRTIADNGAEKRVAAADDDGLGKETEVRPEQEPETPPIAGVKDAKWLLSQNPDRYTLQLIAVRQWEALEKFVRKHPELKGLSFFRFERDGVTWHALLYGDYSSLKAARRAAKTLPRSFRTPWPRKLNSVQKQIPTKGRRAEREAVPP